MIKYVYNNDFNVGVVINENSTSYTLIIEVYNGIYEYYLDIVEKELVTLKESNDNKDYIRLVEGLFNSPRVEVYKTNLKASEDWEDLYDDSIMLEFNDLCIVLECWTSNWTDDDSYIIYITSKEDLIIRYQATHKIINNYLMGFKKFLCINNN